MYKNDVFYVSKDFRFESAHRLSKGYVGKCANIHGHSWNGNITLKCNRLDNMDLSIDFSVIKQRITSKIESIFDHKLILHKKDELCDILRDKTAIFEMELNPTSEAIAKFIYEVAEEMMREYSDFCTVESVTVEETCTSSCTFKKN